MSVAIVTGGSMGLGRALARGLLDRGWSVVVDGRDADALAGAAAGLAPAAGRPARLEVVAGDVTDDAHRAALVAAAAGLGRLDLVVNNASTLGASPRPPLAEYPLDRWREVYEVNVEAPLALVQRALPLLRRSADARVLNVSSDAAVEAYPGWGAYGSSKAALDHWSAVLAEEEPALRVWSVDPGDLRTRMHQEAFPGQDISDRPLPETVVPVLIGLVESDRPSGRYRVPDLGPAAGPAVGRAAVAS
jgi:NAD(P)-dependent dehydrogenase (short-subunit alcohol dehydrogenase family)